MRLQQIRNATVKLTYAETTFLIDPWLAPRGANGAFGMGINKNAFCAEPESQNIVNPMCELPIPVKDILQNVDVNIITHLHFDHIDIADDGTAGAPLNKSILTVTQNEEEKEVLIKSGFEKIHNLNDIPFVYHQTMITNTPCKHGFVKSCGTAMGLILKNPNEPTVYFAGDTIWYEGVSETIKKYQPDVIVVNCCGANLLEFGRLIMNEEDLYQTAMEAPDAIIIAVHMETVSHSTVTRKSLRSRVDSYGIGDRVLIPENGEILKF